jgi:hypothetical protein
MELDTKEAAAALGRRGGLKKSPRKAVASRANLERARRAKAAPVNVQPGQPVPNECAPARRPVLFGAGR